MMYYIDIEDKENFVKRAGKDNLPVWAHGFATKEEASMLLIQTAFDKMASHKRRFGNMFHVFYCEAEYLKNKSKYEKSLKFFDNVVEYVKTKILRSDENKN